jgi:hypothetical protein
MRKLKVVTTTSAAANAWFGHMHNTSARTQAKQALHPCQKGLGVERAHPSRNVADQLIVSLSAPQRCDA